MGRAVRVAAGWLDSSGPLVVVRLGGTAAVKAVVVGGGSGACAAVEAAASGVRSTALVTVGECISVGNSSELAVGPRAGKLRTGEDY